MSNIDQQFIEFVVKSLVGKPEAVQVDRRVDEKGVLLELTVDPEDLGRVIGKRGATAQSLRTLLRALGTKNDARYNLKIIDNGVGGHGYGSESQQPSSDSDNASHSDDRTQPSVQVSDDSGEDNDYVAEKPAAEPSNRYAQTRQELADLDDLDV
jgi:predicted RNA-binding protein YlqC (UPF0109 family)